MTNSLKPKMDIFSSGDACQWAKDFMAYVHANPDICTDEHELTGWFAAAMVKGADRRTATHKQEALEKGRSYLENLPFDGIKNAVEKVFFGYGWNSLKENPIAMLCQVQATFPAIVAEEIMKLKTSDLGTP